MGEKILTRICSSLNQPQIRDQVVLRLSQPTEVVGCCMGIMPQPCVKHCSLDSCQSESCTLEDAVPENWGAATLTAVLVSPPTLYTLPVMELTITDVKMLTDPAVYLRF